MARPRRLATHLALFAAGIALPLILLAVAAGWAYLAFERGRIDHEAQRLVRDIAVDVEREIGALAAAAITLATDDALVRDKNFERFYQRAKSVPIRGGGWVVVWDRTGQQHVDTRVPWGTPLIRQPVDELDRAVFERGETYVSDPFLGGTAQRLVFVVAVPARDAEGNILFGLALVLPAEHLTDTVREVLLPPGWVATLNDRAHRIAARTLDPEKWVGRPMSESGRLATEGVQSRDGGLWDNVFTLEGRPVRGAYYRMPHGWLVSASALREVYEAPVWRVLAAGLAFLLAFAAASALMAAVLGRRIVRALDAVSFKTNALLRGEVVEPPVTPIAEFNTVIVALRRTAEELRARDRHRVLLIDELNHRVKNTLASVQALARRTFKTAAPDLYRTFEQRLIALSGSHNLLTTTNWSGAPLREVIEREVAVYGGRVSLKGDDLTVPPKVVLGLSTIAHELATNAAKYGALSAADGRVRVEWRVEGDVLRMTWTESGGPPVEPAPRAGFGTALITATAERELAGRLRTRFDPSGLQCELEIPLSQNELTYRQVSDAA
jgi:two-component sensor histidine kinase